MPSFPRCGTGAVTGPRASGRLRRTTKGVDMTTVPLSAGRSTAVPSTDVPSTVGHQSVRRRRLRRGMVGGLVATALVLVGSAASAADDVPAGRRIVDHTVRAGETATGLAVRYHAWTAELIRRNHLGSGGGLVVGQRLEIPVVVAALPHRRADRRVTHHTPRHATHHAPRRRAARHPAARPPAGSPRAPPPSGTRWPAPPPASVSTRSSPWRCPGRSRGGRWTAAPTRAPSVPCRCCPPAARGWSCTPAAAAPAPPARQRHRRGHAAARAGRRDQVHAARRRRRTTRASAPSASTGCTARPGRTSPTYGAPGAARGRPPARLNGLARRPAPRRGRLGARRRDPRLLTMVLRIFPVRVAGGSLCSMSETARPHGRERGPWRPPDRAAAGPPLPDRPADRPRRHGQRLRGHRPAPRPHRRGQGDASRARRRRRVRRPLRARGPRRGPALPPERRGGLRPGRRRRHRLPGHGARARAHPARRDPQGEPDGAGAGAGADRAGRSPRSPPRTGPA